MEVEHLIQAYGRGTARMYLYRVEFRDVIGCIQEFWTFRKDDDTEFHFVNADLAVIFAEQNQWEVVDI